ncbi:MAG: transposase [Sinobacteraceae bacterium]|nr:transposase [Nevskiaceae bacterium]
MTQEGLFVTRQTADYVPASHPLLAIREILNRALREMDLLFESTYEDRGRYSVPPERLLRGLVLQALYGIRSACCASNWATTCCTAGSWA